MQALHIFHHNDLDGRMSAALVYAYYKKYRTNYRKFIMHEVDYSMELDFSSIPAGDAIAFVDYSFSGDNNWNKFVRLIEKKSNYCIWIDHHASSKDRLLYFEELYKTNHKNAKSIKANNGDMSSHISSANDKDDSIAYEYIDSNTYVFFSDKYCATWLCYYVYSNKVANEVLHLNEGYYFFDEPDLVPILVRYVDSWDTWKKNIPATDEFNYGCFTLSKDPKLIINQRLGYEVWRIFNPEDDAYKEREDRFIKDIINKGFAIKDYNENVNAGTRKGCMFEFYIVDNRHDDGTRVYKCAGMNTTIFNSSVFGDEVYNEYDMVCPFSMNKDGFWRYSLFSHIKDWNGKTSCKDIAEFIGHLKYSLSGGGHLGSAGFITTKKLIHPNCVLMLKDGLFGNKLAICDKKKLNLK